MNNGNSSLTADALKSAIAQRIASLEAELKTLRGHLKHIEEAEAAVFGMVSPLERIASMKVEITPVDNQQDIGSLGLTDAIKHVMRTAKPTEELGFSPVGVRNILLHYGFEPKGKNFHVSVGTTLKRLANNHLLVEEKSGNKRYYRPSQELLK